MKKNTVSILLLCCILLGAFLFGGCENNRTQSGRTADYTLTFYRSRSSGQTDGEDDAKVTQALEDKYYEDTGVSVKLVMKMFSGNDLSTQVDINYPKSGTDLECVSHYLSDADGSAISKYAKEKGATVDMQSILNEYGKNILKAIRTDDTDHLAERAAWFNNDGKWGMHALPGVSEESCFAVLVRKDMVEDVKSVTGIDPEDYDIANDEYANLTFNEFYKLMYAIKKKVQGVTYPVVGAPWDIGRVFGTALGVDSFNNAYDAEGNFVPSQMQPDYDKYLMTMWHWAKDGIWEKDAAVNSDDNRLTAFVAGQAACYIAYPEIKNLITVARKAQQANPGSEYMILAPLATSKDKADYDYLYNEKIDPATLAVEDKTEGKLEVIGNLRNPRAFYGLILPYMNKQPEHYIQFIDWLYADKENYELAKYGIKGTHWTDGEPKTVDGVSYETWKYPDEFASKYQTRPPYSGAWEILENVNVSNRLRSDYNTLETKWFVKVTNDFPSYSSGTEGIWMTEIPRELNGEAGHIGEWIENVRGKAWAGIYGGAEKDQTPAQLLKQYLQDMKTKAPNYLKHIADEYRASQEYFAQLFAD